MSGGGGGGGTSAGSTASASTATMAAAGGSAFVALVAVAVAVLLVRRVRATKASSTSVPAVPVLSAQNPIFDDDDDGFDYNGGEGEPEWYQDLAGVDDGANHYARLDRSSAGRLATNDAYEDANAGGVGAAKHRVGGGGNVPLYDTLDTHIGTARPSFHVTSPKMQQEQQQQEEEGQDNMYLDVNGAPQQQQQQGQDDMYLDVEQECPRDMYMDVAHPVQEEEEEAVSGFGFGVGFGTGMNGQEGFDSDEADGDGAEDAGYLQVSAEEEEER